MLSLKNKIKKLPKTPGVYLFYDEDKSVLYVGKAGSLRDRVGSYFSGRDERKTAKSMLPQIADIKIKKTETVLEALILESQLIKKYHPKYNIRDKDDKSFCYFAITKEDFPKVLIVRKKDLDQFRNSKFKTQGQDTKTKNKKARTPSHEENYSNIYGPYTSKHNMNTVLKIIRRIFPFHDSDQKTEKGCLNFQIGRCPGPYAGAISKADYLKNIHGIKMILEGKKKSLIKKLEKEMKTCADNNDFERAAEARNKLFALKHIQDVALIKTEDSIGYSKAEFLSSPMRIEAFDISNISGQCPTGSMVVFENNQTDKSQYRKFKIKNLSVSDDIKMMEEVLTRRFKNNWAKPNLILLDGGRGHLNMAERLLRKLGLFIPIVAVAKGKSRKSLNFQFPFSNQFSISKFSNLNKIVDNKNLIKHIMDEAHRFAIEYHRKIRKKKIFN